MQIARRLFVVPLANNDHGKTTMLRALVNQGQGSALKANHKKNRSLTSPWGRPIDAYVFGRSYQEMEKKPHGPYGSVEAALDGNDPHCGARANSSSCPAMPTAVPMALKIATARTILTR